MVIDRTSIRFWSVVQGVECTSIDSRMMTIIVVGVGRVVVVNVALGFGSTVTMIRRWCV